MKKLNIAFIALLVSPLAEATPIAVIDSGTDLNHPSLTNVRWTNLKDEDDAVDNDDNGYIDDVHGWNFAEQNDQLFDKRLLGKFSKDAYRFFEIQTKNMLGTATPEELLWMKEKLQDQNFVTEVMTFGNFIHGSHVAGIAARNSPKAQIMPLKLIPTKRPKPFGSIEQNGMIAKATSARGDENKKKLIFMALDFLGKQQAQAFAPISSYMKTQGARVANCSFGTGYAQAKALLEPLLNRIFKRELPEAELHEYVSYFMAANLKNAEESFVQGAPNTLFVMAAGNDGSNNDSFPASPANIKTNNTITVAATFGLEKIAWFSNYGEKMVDVAAPGVAILSAIPGGESIMLSGTSQAAPFVANIAGQLLDINPLLSTSELKEILLGTSDYKEFLKGKVRASGIVNGERAKKAAKFTLTESVLTSIMKAKIEIADQVEALPLRSELLNADNVYVQPLPSLDF